jgi:hypothetical protein
MTTTSKPKKKIVLRTQQNAFAPIVSYTMSGSEWTEEVYSYRDKSDATMAHAVRGAGDSAKFIRIVETMLSTGKIQYDFVFLVKRPILDRV